MSSEVSLAFLTVEFALSPILSLQLHLMPSFRDQAIGKEVSATFSMCKNEISECINGAVKIVKPAHS